MIRPKILAALPLALLAACQSGGDGNAAADATNAQADLTPEGPSIAAQLFGGGKPMPLSIQVAHPDGVVLQVTSIQAKADETVIGIAVQNGDDDERELNAFPNNRNAYIVAGNGERFYLSPPPGNPELKVGAGQKMNGELVFVGRLPKDGGGTLILNDGDQGNEYDSSPGFRIPLPLTSAAWSDDGSKKKSLA